MNEPYVTPPTKVSGLASRVQLHEVVAVNPDGTVNTRLATGRSGKVNVPTPLWYLAAIGDRVLIADRDGDQQAPYVVAPFDAGTTPPALSAGTKAAIAFSPAGAGVTFPATGGIPFTSIAPAGSAWVADGRGGSTLQAPATATSAAMPPGAITAYAGATAPGGWLFCDGASYTTATYPALFAAIGYAYGGAGASFNVPDMRGRVPVGADNMGTGAAGRLTASNSLGASAGEMSHALLNGEMPIHNHTGLTGTGTTGTGTTGAGTTGGQNATHTHATPNHSHSSLYNSISTVQQGTGAFTNLTGGGPIGWTISGGQTFTDTSGGGTTGANSVDHSHSVPGLSVPGLSVPALSVANDGGGLSHNNMQPYQIANYLIKT